jgi:RimJ/RimL family protein N-acetyltransferase
METKMCNKEFRPAATSRLELRRLDLSDSEVFFEYRSLPEVYKFQSFKPNGIKEAQTFIRGISEYPDIPNTWFQLAVCLKNNGKLIGDIGIHFMEDNSNEIQIHHNSSAIQRNKGVME